MNKTLTLILTVMLLLLTACGGSEESAESGKLDVVTTIGQITNTVEIVGGDHIEVTGLMGPGVDPHTYTSKPSDLEKLTSADVVFYNGLFLEATMEDVLEQMAEEKTVVAVTANIDRSGLLDSADYAGQNDPHIWFEIPLWMQAVEQVRDTLSEADPDNAADYAANADAFLAELDTLHQYVQEQADRVPAEQRVLITAHDAFGYFGRAYGFDVQGLQGISTEAEAGTGDVQALADFIADNQIPAIFVESSVPPRTIEAVQAAVESRGFAVEIGGELFSDAMGDPGTPEGTYVGMVTHNIDTIVGALLGE